MILGIFIPLCFADELKAAGVFWTSDSSRPVGPGPRPIGPRPIGPGPVGVPTRPSFGPTNVYLTRLHLRYDERTHPEDLRFEVTDNRENFQGRYVLRRPFKGDLTCDAFRIGGRECLIGRIRILYTRILS